jgi:alginate O-acetyltransferase complex protein AlgI
VIIGWVFFRIENIQQAFVFISQMFSFVPGTRYAPDTEFVVFFVLAVFFSFFVLLPYGKKIQDAVFVENYPMRRYYVVGTLAFFLVLICISSITAFGFNPFIYFRF